MLPAAQTLGLPAVRPAAQTLGLPAVRPAAQTLGLPAVRPAAQTPGLLAVTPPSFAREEGGTVKRAQHWPRGLSWTQEPGALVGGALTLGPQRLALETETLGICRRHPSGLDRPQGRRVCERPWAGVDHVPSVCEPEHGSVCMCVLMWGGRPVGHSRHIGSGCVRYGCPLFTG